jgi:hypothetical protein
MWILACLLFVGDDAPLYTVVQAANSASDHVPLSMYDYEICVTKPTPCRGASSGGGEDRGRAVGGVSGGERGGSR